MKKTTLGAAMALAVLMVGCGDGIGDVTTGGPSATPTPVPTATATPTPTATPAATPTPNTGVLSCTLPPRLPNCDATCCRAGGSVEYRVQIEEAQDDLRRNQSSLFFSNGDVRDNFQYLAALAKRLTERTGLCSQALGHDEIRVKGNNDRSQHVDVLIADVSPSVLGAYSCTPASF